MVRYQRVCKMIPKENKCNDRIKFNCKCKSEPNTKEEFDSEKPISDNFLVPMVKIVITHI